MTANVILGVTGSVITLTLLFEMMRRHHLREKYAAFWVAVAMGTLLIAAFPSVLRAAADLVGVAVPSNLLFFVASMVLMSISIQHSHELGRLEERTRTLAEELAILRMERTIWNPEHPKSD